MSRESKVGLLMIVMLFSIFGFMLYKRMYQPAQAMAQEESSPIDATEADVDDDPPVAAERRLADPEQPPRIIPDDLTVGRVSTDSIDKVEQKRDRAVERDADPFAAIESPPARTKPKLPTQIPDVTEPSFRRPKPSAAPKEEQRLRAPGRDVAAAKSDLEDLDLFSPPPKAATVTPGLNDFDRTPVAVERRTEDPFDDPEKMRDEPAKKLAPPDGDAFTKRDDRREVQEIKRVESEVRKAVNEDLFEAPVARQPSKAEKSERPKAQRNANSIQLAAATPDDFGSGSSNTSGTVPQPAGDDPFGDLPAKPNPLRERPRMDRDGFNEPASQPSTAPENPRRINRPAPVTQIDEDFAARTTSQPLIAGDSYQVEPSDNFWTISRKKYGTGRYFMALAQHNSQVIPDPKMMKPGVTIATPSVRHLEQAYPQLIPKAGPAGSVGPIQTASTAATSVTAEAPGGFYVSNEGIPMYRVGKEDTLSDISQRHLGRSSRWIQVYQLNRDVLTDGNTLKIGMQLRLPADASRVEVVGNARTFR